MESKKNIVIGILVVLLLCSIGLIVYLFIDKSNSGVNDEKTEQKEEVAENKTEELDINDPLVKELYDNVAAEDCLMAHSIVYNIKDTQKLTVNDLDEMKNYLGYRQVPITKVKSGFCSDYRNILEKENNSYGCGESPLSPELINNLKYESTYYIEEQDLKESVEMIFGPGTYERKDFLLYRAFEGFLFDESTLRYFYYMDGPVAAIIPKGETTIVSATKTNDSIEIIQNVKYFNPRNEIAKEGNVKYTFKYNEEDDKYYFYSVERIEK